MAKHSGKFTVPTVATIETVTNVPSEHKTMFPASMAINKLHDERNDLQKTVLSCLRR